MSQDLPIAAKVVELNERIEANLPQLDEMIGGGLMTLEKVRVILHTPNKQDTSRNTAKNIFRNSSISGIAWGVAAC